jgi:hypothetical protein
MQVYPSRLPHHYETQNNSVRIWMRMLTRQALIGGMVANAARGARPPESGAGARRASDSGDQEFEIVGRTMLLE